MINPKQYKKIAKLLNEFCIPKNLSGYNYIISAIYVLYKNNSDFSIADLYSEIAKEYNTKPSNVERSIRHAIERGYDICMDCNFDTFRRVSFSNKKPQNSEFLKGLEIEFRLQESINS